MKISRITPVRIIVAIMTLGVAGCRTKGPPLIANDAARRIIDQMRAAYANCKSYVDTGEVKTNYMKGGKVTQTDLLTFQTRYLSPGKLRFEFDMPGPVRQTHYVLWSTGVHVAKEFFHVDNYHFEDTYLTSLYDTDRKEIRNGLEMSHAIARYTGISNGVAAVVPVMIFQVKGWGQPMPEDLVVKREEHFEGSRCFVLSSRSEHIDMWIDESSHLIRKLVEETDLAELGTAESVTIYHPQFNVNVDEHVFDFKPSRANAEAETLVQPLGSP